MGVIVNLIDEVRNRLETATGTGKDLVSVKRVNVGTVEECRKLNDFPFINIGFPSAEELNKRTSGGMTSKLLIVVTLCVNKLAATNGASSSNSLYKKSDESGMLFLLEKVLNVLDKNTSETPDLSFDNTSDELRITTYDIDSSNDFFNVTINIDIETKQFTTGDR